MSCVADKIHRDLSALGIKPSDTLLMHSSFKSLGEIEGGAAAFFDALLSYFGNEGTLVLPALSFVAVSRKNPKFNLLESPSCIGYLAEYFRTSVAGVKRSMHATHSCCAIGKHADELISNHELDITPVGENSPFAKLPKLNGKIIFVGCSSNHNTSMHGVEELCEPPYLLDRENKVTYELDDGEGNIILRESFRHNFVKSDGSHYAQHYSRVERLLCEDEIKRGKLLLADCVVMDAEAVWRCGTLKLKNDPYYFVE